MPLHKNRERFDTDFREVTTARWIAAPLTQYVQRLPFWTCTRYAEMKDVTGPRVLESGIKAPKPCEHARFAMDGLRPIPNHVGFTGTWVTTIDTFPKFDTSGQVFDLLCPYPSAEWTSENHLTAFNEFSTQFPEIISLGNFLIELKDLPSLLPRISGNVTEDLASLYLSQEFGVKPFLDDLRKLSTILASIDARLQFLRDTRNKPTRLGYYNAYESMPSEFNAFGHSGSELCRVIPAGYKVEYRAGGTLVQDLGELDQVQDYIRAFLGSTGLSNPFKTAWNAIPFSFVVDWVTNVGSRFDSLNFQDQTGKWLVINPTHSVTVESRGKIIHWNESTYASSPYGETLAAYRVKRYKRGLGLPWDAGSLAFDSLSPKQLALSLAMLRGFSK